MRKLALAASVALAVAAIAGPALARPWNDPRMTMDVPNGYTVVDGSHQQQANRTYVETAAPDDDCAFWSTDAQIANANVARTAISDEARFPASYLTQVAGMFPRIVPAGATVTSNTMDTSGAWPIRRVTYSGGGKTAHVAIQWRPNLQLIAACTRYEGAESQSSRYDAIFRSIGHPNDATWLTEAQSQATAQTAQQQAAAEAAAQQQAQEQQAQEQQQQQQQPQRDRRDRRLGRRD